MLEKINLADTVRVMIQKLNIAIDAIIKFPTKLPADGGDSKTVNGKTVESNVPENAMFTDTIVTKADLGLDKVDNTRDIDKPVSTDVANALSGKVDNSQVLTSVPKNAKFTDTLATKASVGLGEVTDDKQLPIKGGTMTGVLKAQSNKSYGTAQVRNISISTANPSGGNDGDVWIKYR